MGLVNNGVSPNSNPETSLLSGYNAFLKGWHEGNGIKALQGRGQDMPEVYGHGFNDGQQSGYDKGWNDGIERGNHELMKADGYIKSHIADKDRLQQTVDEQARQIQQLMAHIAALEDSINRKDDAMRVIQDSPLPRMARELQAENEQLRAQVQALQADNEAKTQECTERTWRTNRATTVLNAMRSTLEALTADKDSSQTAEIEHLFCEHYKREVASGLEKGYLREPLEDDAIFAKTMPATHRFLTSILQAVNERIEIDHVGHHDDGNWVPDGS